MNNSIKAAEKLNTDAVIMTSERQLLAQKNMTCISHVYIVKMNQHIYCTSHFFIQPSKSCFRQRYQVVFDVTVEKPDAPCVCQWDDKQHQSTEGN